MSKLKEKTSNGLIWSGIMSFLQQIIGLFFYVIIARKLGPSDFGMVGILTIFTAVATCLQDGGLVWALTNRNHVTHVQYSSIFWFNLILSCIIYSVLFFCAPIIAKFFKQEELVWVSRYVFLAIIFSSMGVVQTAYLYRQIKVKERAIATIIGLIVAGIVGVILSYSGFSYWGIATQSVLNIGVTTCLLWLFSPLRPSFTIDRYFLKEIIPEGFRFVVSNVLAIASENVFSVILGKKYTLIDVGNFTQAAKWNTAAYSSILGMMRGVSQPVLVQVRDDSVLYLNVFRKLFRMAGFIVIPILLILASVSREFIEVILTSEWYGAALILKILCFGGIFSVLNTMFSYFIISINRTKLYMNLSIIFSVLQVLSAFIASYWGIMALAYAYSSVSLVFFFIYYAFVLQTHSYRIELLLKDLVPILTIAIISILIINYATVKVESPYILLFTKTCLTIVLYIILMYLIKSEPYMEIVNYIKFKINS